MSAFSIPPYTGKLVSRAIQKPPKVYFFDNQDVICKADEGPRFENLLATHLLKKIHFLQDSQGLPFEMKYIRDKESREVDFIILNGGQPFALIDAKLSEDKISRSLQYYSEKLKPKHSLQVVAYLKREYKKSRCRVVLPQTALRTLFG